MVYFKSFGCCDGNISRHFAVFTVKPDLFVFKLEKCGVALQNHKLLILAKLVMHGIKLVPFRFGTLEFSEITATRYRIQKSYRQTNDFMVGNLTVTEFFIIRK